MGHRGAFVLCVSIVEQWSLGFHEALVCHYGAFVLQRMQPPLILNTGLHVALFLSSLAEALGRYSLPKPPPPCPPLNLAFPPELQEFSLVQTLVCIRSCWDR